MMVKDLELTQADKEKRWLFVELSTEGAWSARTSRWATRRGARRSTRCTCTTPGSVRASSSRPSSATPRCSPRRARCSTRAAGSAGTPPRARREWFASEDEAKEAGASRRNRISCTDLALQIAQQVNKENQGNVLQIRAQKLISSIIDRPGVQVAPAVLYEGGRGQLQRAGLAGGAGRVPARARRARGAGRRHAPRVLPRGSTSAWAGPTSGSTARSRRRWPSRRASRTGRATPSTTPRTPRASTYRAMQEVVREVAG